MELINKYAGNNVLELLLNIAYILIKRCFWKAIIKLPIKENIPCRALDIWITDPLLLSEVRNMNVPVVVNLGLFVTVVKVEFAISIKKGVVWKNFPINVRQAINRFFSTIGGKI